MRPVPVLEAIILSCHLFRGGKKNAKKIRKCELDKKIKYSLFKHIKLEEVGCKFLHVSIRSNLKYKTLLTHRKHIQLRKGF